MVWMKPRCAPACSKEYNIEVGGGLGELKGKVIRIGLMGYSSRPENIVLFLAALERILTIN